MRILLDESLPRRLKADLKPYRVKTVSEMGWQGKKNGELLRLMLSQFDVFITVDQNLPYQSNLKLTQTDIIILVSSSNRYEGLQLLM